MICADIEKKFNKRVLTVSEVGHGFEESLKIDQNGGCVILYPDVAPFLMPDNGNKVRNIWFFFSPLVPSKQEKTVLVLLSLYIF